MRRILACLATLTLTAAAGAVHAQAQTNDPIGDLIAATSQPAAANAADWSLKATLYHGGGGMSTRDSLGCKVSPMRTVAIDRNLITRGAILFIKQTVGMLLPGGGRHDGYWYASDTGALIKGQRIDLFTGPGSASMASLYPLNLRTLTVKKVGQFKGCPPVDGSLSLSRIAKVESGSVLGGQPAVGAKWTRAERPALLPAAYETPASGLEGWLGPKSAPASSVVDFRQPDIAE
jgi:3D (Asp-Asp-Asp) domain-containing protein